MKSELNADRAWRGWRVGRFFLLLGNAICIVACFGVTLFCIGGIIMGIHDQAVGVAQRPRYRADCTQETRYAPGSPASACYQVKANMTLRVEQTRQSYNSVADVTLPGGKVMTEYLDQVEWDPKTVPPSGSYGAEVWRGTVTRIVVRGQSIPTYDNPLIMTQGSGVLYLVFGVAGIVTAVFGVGGVRAFRRARSAPSVQVRAVRPADKDKRRWVH